MVLFLNLFYLGSVIKIEKNRPFTTTDEGFLEKLRISNPFENSKSNGFGLIHTRGSSCFSFSHSNFRYSFLFLIKRMASSSGNPSYS
ncbi:hypothetical protein RIF29_43257 [Crotalaria pallida]|uniref:Uncharacterized protein n=1 Tax=Crotalaria pallida TaxID=3830 RepID=A0AAN9DWW0_CROPI